VSRVRVKGLVLKIRGLWLRVPDLGFMVKG
jgi:hypothetical protein